MSHSEGESERITVKRKHSVSGANHRNPIQRPGKNEKAICDEGNLS